MLGDAPLVGYGVAYLLPFALALPVQPAASKTPFRVLGVLRTQTINLTEE